MAQASVSPEWRNEEKYQLVFDSLQNLVQEFHSLENYEYKLVFPSILLMIGVDTDKPEYPVANISQLKMLTESKESTILTLAAQLAKVLHDTGFPSEHEGMRKMVRAFRFNFRKVKQNWNQLITDYFVSNTSRIHSTLNILDND